MRSGPQKAAHLIRKEAIVPGVLAVAMLAGQLVHADEAFIRMSDGAIAVALIPRRPLALVTGLRHDAKENVPAKAMEPAHAIREHGGCTCFTYVLHMLQMPSKPQKQSMRGGDTL